MFLSKKFIRNAFLTSARKLFGNVLVTPKNLLCLYFLYLCLNCSVAILKAQKCIGWKPIAQGSSQIILLWGV